jgi:glycosyltransferase involved in cell wall biosynthesis
MQLCEEVVDGLAAKGHDPVVLTSTRCDGPEIDRPYPVHRVLTIDPDWHTGRSGAWQFFIGRKRRAREAVAHLERLVEQTEPDVIFVWHASGLPRVLLQSAEALDECVTVYYLANYLPELQDEHIAYWEAQPVHPLAKVIKGPVAHMALRQLRREGKPIALEYRHAICVSAYLRRRLVSQGLIPKEAVVIHNGVDLSVFSPEEGGERDVDRSRLRCLVAGRVAAEKGIHTVIDALDLLGERRDIILTILGDGPAHYTAYLRRQVETHGLQDTVRFEPPIPRSSMPEKMADYDVLILPSEYQEPISRAMQEAMAMGLLVIGTETGGSGELLVHEETGLVFEAADAQSLAQRLRRALDDAESAAALARAGQARVRNEFNIDLTVDRIEAYLQTLFGRAP